MEKESKQENGNIALHFKYFALITTLAIIFMATERWSSKPDFTTYLSNAATMTSLLLGVVAIFYSFISNDGMSRNLGSINTVVNEVREVRNDIQNFSEETKRNTEIAGTNNILVKEASVELSEMMTSLTETLSAISFQNDTLKDVVSNLPNRIDQLENKFGDVAKAIAENPQQNQTSVTEIPAKVTERFLFKTTFSQHLFVIACVLANEKDKPLDITSFCNKIELNAVNSFQGFANCMNAVQLCSLELLEGKDKVYKIKSIHPELQKKAQTTYSRYVETTFANKTEAKEKWLSKLTAVQGLFA